MKITATQVKELREKTGAGFMDCKAALTEAGGDLVAAEDILKKKGQERSDNRSGRETSEGVIAIQVFEDSAGRGALLVQVFCETDFVARNEEFIAFAQLVADTTTPFILHPELFETERVRLAATLGENIQVGGLTGSSSSPPVVIGTYLHSDRRIGAAVGVTSLNVVGLDPVSDEECKEIARDIAMHVVAMQPLYQVEGLITKDEKNAQREIFEAQVQASGKPEKLWERIIDGKMAKWVANSCLMTQPFVKDTSVTVEKYLESKRVDFRSCSWQGLKEAP